MKKEVFQGGGLPVYDVSKLFLFTLKLEAMKQLLKQQNLGIGETVHTLHAVAPKLGLNEI